MPFFGVDVASDPDLAEDVLVVDLHRLEIVERLRFRRADEFESRRPPHVYQESRPEALCELLKDSGHVEVGRQREALPNARGKTLPLRPG